MSGPQTESQSKIEPQDIKPAKKMKRIFGPPPSAYLLDENDTQSQMEKLNKKKWRKIKENPLVPVGMLATVTALVLGLRAFYVGNSKLSQKMMRFRVLAQGATVTILIGGVLLSSRSKADDP